MRTLSLVFMRMGLARLVYSMIWVTSLGGCALTRLQSKEEKEICPGYIMKGKNLPDFTSNEKKLICGEKVFNPHHPNEAWMEIPFPQAKFNLTNFLQGQGYHFPIFIRKSSRYSVAQVNSNLIELPSHEKDQVIVEAGQQSLATRFVIEGNHAGFDLSRKRDILGQPLTPRLLSNLEQWVQAQLQNGGYACSQVSTLANPATGEIRVQINPGLRFYFDSINTESVDGLDPNVLRRFDAFRPADLFNESLLALTENRIRADGIVESSYFTKSCSKDGVHLQQMVIPGLSRLLTVGGGINSEGLILGRMTWENTRLDAHGTLLSLSAMASARIQRVNAKANWYAFPLYNRLYINPSVQFLHRDEIPYEFASAQSALGAVLFGDRENTGATFFLGPTYNYYRTLRGVGAPRSSIVSFEGRLTIKSHDYEYYMTNPQSGYFLNLVTDLSSRVFFSDATAQRIFLRAEKLWNLAHWDPPLWILGIRAGYSTTITQEKTGFGTPLPANFFEYLGGSGDLRGFGRQEIPLNQNYVNLTSGFIGIEARWSHTLPFGIDPFVFLDGGALGASSILFDSSFYWSPGIGIRWASPLGPVRTTFAHGFMNEAPVHFQWYFSFGEEF